MTLRALIFDVDGTLAETEETHRAAFNQTFAARGLDWHWSKADYRALLQTTGGRERIRAFQAGLVPGSRRLSDEEIAHLHREKTELYKRLLSDGHLKLRPGVAELVAMARRQGLKLAVATTTNLQSIEALTRCCWQADAGDVFDVIAAGDEVAAKKPAPDVYELALAHLALDPSSCVAFEDSLNGVRAAQGAGLAVVVAPSVYTAHEDFSRAQAVVESLNGIGLARLTRLASNNGA